MINYLKFLVIVFAFSALVTQVASCQDTLKQRYTDPYYSYLWPYDLEFKEDFSTPDSIISSESGEISLVFEYDTTGTIYNISISRITLKDKNGLTVYEYSVYGDLTRLKNRADDKDEMFYRISHLVHMYLYNELKFVRNDRPFFRERYTPRLYIYF